MRNVGHRVRRFMPSDILRQIPLAHPFRTSTLPELRRLLYPPAMRNFMRVLRLSWAYRVRIIVSAVAALLVALFWSLNLSAVYPVLQILSADKNLQQWVAEQIALNQKKADDAERIRHIDALR